MFEIALVDCKVLGIVRTLVEGSSAWKAIELRPGEIWPDSCHSRTKPSYVRPNRWRTLRGEYYRAPILVWTVLAYWNLWLPVCFTWIPRLVWVLVLESLRLTSVLGVGWNLNFSLIFSWYSSLFRIECSLSLQTKARPPRILNKKWGRERRAGERRLALFYSRRFGKVFR